MDVREICIFQAVVVSKQNYNNEIIYTSTGQVYLLKSILYTKSKVQDFFNIITFVVCENLWQTNN